MYFINAQFLTLLTTIIAIVSNLLSLNEKIGKIGVVNILKVLSYYLLPLLFIREIILIYYNNKLVISFILLTITFLIIALNKILKIHFINNDTTTVLVMNFLSAVFFIIGCFVTTLNIKNYNQDISRLINELILLDKLKDVYVLLLDDLFLTLCLIGDMVTLILSIVVLIKESLYYEKYIFEELNIDCICKSNINFRRLAENSAVLLFLSTGIYRNIFYYVAEMF